MIFVQPLYYNFLSHTHIIFLFSLFFSLSLSIYIYIYIYIYILFWTNEKRENESCHQIYPKWLYIYHYSSFIHIDILIEYITSHTNIAKNLKGESLNKLTTPKLIAYNDKMPTNNMIKFKSLKFPCFRICNVDAQIID